MTASPLLRNNVRVLGNASSGRSIVFAHGFGSSQASWRFVYESFLQDYQVILYDLTGCGESLKTEFTVDRYGLGVHGHAADLVELCDVLGVRGGLLVAHSMSAMVGALAILNRPDLFSK